MSLERGHIAIGQTGCISPLFFVSSFLNEFFGSDALVEAIPDLFTWFVFEPSFQDEYFGVHASPIENLLCKHSSVMFDICWSLFGMIVWMKNQNLISAFFFQNFDCSETRHLTQIKFGLMSPPCSELRRILKYRGGREEDSLQPLCELKNERFALIFSSVSC